MARPSTERSFSIRPIGYVRSPFTSRDEAPRQGSEGAPDAWLELDESLRSGLDGIEVGDASHKMKVGPLEAIEGTPIVDIKPVLPVQDH